MIQVDILLDSTFGTVCGISLNGHANSGPYGQDLVCAAVSSIITGGANAIHKKHDFDIELESGYAKIIKKPGRKVSTKDEIVLNVIATQLETVEESYGQFIKTNIRKVNL